MDLRHTEVSGVVTNVRVKDEAKRCIVDLESNDGDEMADMESWRFAFSQLLKFADLRKKDLKDDEGSVLPDAGSKVVDALEGRELTFKYNKQRTRPLIAVVSPNYATIPSEEVSDIVRETIASMGISDFEFHERGRGRLTEEFDFVFQGDEYEREVADVGDMLRGGISVKNSVFGASSLQVSQFLTVLACSNGMTRRKTEASFKRVHMGSASEIREMLTEEVEAQVENLWESTDLIQNIATIEFPIQKQLEFLSDLADKGKITKSSATLMAGHIISESGNDLESYEEMELEFDLPEKLPEDDIEWNTGREDVWGLMNAFTGYATHSELSGTSTLRKMERVYNDILDVESEDELLAIAE